MPVTLVPLTQPADLTTLALQSIAFAIRLWGLLGPAPQEADWPVSAARHEKEH
jgi:hypothetical protein